MKKEIKKSLKLKSVVTELNNSEKKEIKGGTVKPPVPCPGTIFSYHRAGCKVNMCDTAFGN